MNEKMNILIMAANPKDATRLRLDEEIREIIDGLQRSKYREQIQIIPPRLAVRSRGLRRALLDYEPQIVHFCGHGDEKGIFVENEIGASMLIGTKALEGLFELLSDHVYCVFLNACYSEPQAKAIAKHINYVIGLKKSIHDKASIEFSVGFYDAIGAGKSIEEAFKFGCNALQNTIPKDEQKPEPVLIKKTYYGKSPFQVRTKFCSFIKMYYRDMEGKIYFSRKISKDISDGHFFYWESTSGKFKDYRKMSEDYHYDVTEDKNFKSLPMVSIAYYIQEASHDESKFIASVITKINCSQYTVQLFTNWQEYAEKHPSEFQGENNVLEIHELEGYIK
jgi:hypothetical protein